jgi:hypothetical protein
MMEWAARGLRTLETLQVNGSMLSEGSWSKRAALREYVREVMVGAVLQ